VKLVVSTLWDKDSPKDALGWKLALTASSSTTAQTFLAMLVEFLNTNQLEPSRIYPPAAKTLDSSRNEVHKAAYLLISLGYGAGEDGNDMVEEVLFQGRVHGSGVARALICIQSGWPTSIRSSKGRYQLVEALLYIRGHCDLVRK
jgi:hypothetical protein